MIEETESLNDLRGETIYNKIKEKRKMFEEETKAGSITSTKDAT
jgi:hypothetical protein